MKLVATPTMPSSVNFKSREERAVLRNQIKVYCSLCWIGLEKEEADCLRLPGCMAVTAHAAAGCLTSFG